jgi:tetratricopeptide (TPR) repeat protein
MKKLIQLLTLALVLVAPRIFAQQEDVNYQSAMKEIMAKMDTAESVQANISVANDFDRVAGIAQTQWHPYYYAALCTVLAAFDIEDRNKVDELCDRANQLLEKSEKLSPKNSENYCVKSMISLARIRVNMMQRGMEGLMEAQASLEIASEIDPNNPRVYFLLGQQAYNTPEAFGGSKKKALQFYEKAITLFDKQKDRAGTFEVNWGQKTTARMITECQKFIKTKEAKVKSDK